MHFRDRRQVWLVRAFLLAATASGATLVLKAALTISQPTGSTRIFINLESICALALIGLTLFSSTKISSTQTLKPRDVFVLPGLLLLIALCFSRALTMGFLSDDFISITYANRLTSHELWGTFTRPSAGAFFRPLEYVSLRAMAPLAHFDPVRWHAGNLVLHWLNSILVYKLVRHLYPGGWIAGVASLLFAIHGSRPEAVAWVNGRLELVTALFFLAALLLYLRHCETGRVGLLAVSLLCLLTALLLKESAYAFPLVLLAIAAFRKDPAYRRPLAQLPFWLVTLAVFGYRWKLLHGIGGYLNRAGEPQFLETGLMSPIKALGLRVWAVLYFPINWSVPAEPWLVLLTIFYVVGLIWLAKSTANRSGVYFPLAFTLILSLPAAAWLLIGAELEKSRLLYLPSLGYCMLMGVSLDAMRRSKMRWLVAAAVVAFHIGALEHNLTIWKQVSILAAQTCAVNDLPPPGLPASVNGVYFFANGFSECVAMRSGMK